MSILGSNWLPEGYYEDDGYGYTFVDDPERIRELHREGKLYEHDGMSINKVNESDIITIKKR
jgi:hypothetical protein